MVINLKNLEKNFFALLQSLHGGTDRDIQTRREAEREREKEKDRHTDSQTVRSTERQTESERQRQRSIYIYMLISISLSLSLSLSVCLINKIFRRLVPNKRFLYLFPCYLFYFSYYSVESSQVSCGLWSNLIIFKRECFSATTVKKNFFLIIAKYKNFTAKHKSLTVKPEDQSNSV